MNQLFCQVGIALLAIRRDKVLHALVGTGFLLLLLVPAFSLFSMRQVQQLSITLCLSASSGLLLVLTVLLGGASIWRDLEKRYLFSSLGMPLQRSNYLLGKYLGICACLQVSTLLIACCSVAVIKLTSLQVPSVGEVHWGTLLLAFQMDCLKYMLLCAIAVFFSSLATSFFVPIFGTLAIYMVGSASQEVMEYLRTDYADKLPGYLTSLCEGLYYILPNFTIFDLKVYAVYSLPIEWSGVGLALVYFLIYTALVLMASVHNFSRREMI